MKKDCIAIEDFTCVDYTTLLERAAFFENNGYEKVLQDHIIASIFFEASTRTRLSFETAAHRLGARVIGFSEPSGTSMHTKGESFEDTIRMIDGYADCIVIRHPEIGAARVAADIASVPVINAGDGANQHPTQTLLDLYAIHKTQETIDGLTVAIVGDLKYGRVPHSLAKALTVFTDVTQLWVAPEELQMPEEVREYVRNRNGQLEELQTIEEIIERADIVYMTRVQVDRFTDMNAYEQLKDVYILTPEMVERGKKNMRILHALPRTYEIPETIDALPQAYYFQQARSGVPVRAALLEYLLK